MNDAQRQVIVDDGHHRVRKDGNVFACAEPNDLQGFEHPDGR